MLSRLWHQYGDPPPDGKGTPIHFFSSQCLRHIEIAIQRGIWAVADIDLEQRAARVTKARNLEIGDHGLFYSSDEECFTVPFVVKSKPENRVVSNVWPGNWYFPFGIAPLGDLSRRICLPEAYREWETLKGVDNVTKALNLSGGMAFVESWLFERDWKLILQKLSTGNEGLNATRGGSPVLLGAESLG